MPELHPDDFLQKVGKNYIAPYTISVPTGTVYDAHSFPRGVLVTPLTPATAGQVYFYPGSQPSGDVNSSSVPGTPFYLPAGGLWYIRHSGSGTEKFKVEDMGSAANAAASAIAAGLVVTVTAESRSAFYTAQKSVAVPSTAEQCAAQAIPKGFALLVSARVTNTGNVGIGNSLANADLVTGVPKILAPGQGVRLLIDNANLVWVDAIVATEGVDLIVEV